MTEPQFVQMCIDRIVAGSLTNSAADQMLQRRYEDSTAEERASLRKAITDYQRTVERVAQNLGQFGALDARTQAAQQ